MQDIKNNYYYVGCIDKYGLLIIKKLPSHYNGKLNNVLSNLCEDISIWEDINTGYKKLYKICNALNINVSGNEECILIDIYGKNYNLFLDIFNLIYIKVVKYDKSAKSVSIETNILYNKFISIERELKSTIVDMNVVPVINKYLVSKLDVYIELMHLKYNIPHSIIHYSITNHNIYKMDTEYFTQINDTFCRTNEIGIPIDYHQVMGNICVHKLGVCDEINCKYSLNKELIRNSRNWSDTYVFNHSITEKNHNIIKCSSKCNDNNCIIHKNVFCNLLRMCKDICALKICKSFMFCRCNCFCISIFDMNNLDFTKNANKKYTSIFVEVNNKKYQFDINI